MNYEFQRVAIVNRGEAAMRFIHAAREFNQEHGTALRTIALFTEPDRSAMFVREADETVCLGSARALDLTTGQFKSRYVDYESLCSGIDLGTRRCSVGGMGFCGRARCVRRSLPRHGHCVYRPRCGRDAATG